MESVKVKQDNAIASMKGALGYTNDMAAPRITKVVVSTGTGRAIKLDRKRNEFIAERLARITGQKVAIKPAKKSIASFKLREGDPIGLAVTLRGQRMYDFLDRLINVAVPRIRDFRGFDKTSIDAVGNLTLGIREHNIFPETADEEFKDVFGLAITIVTTATTKAAAEALFREIGIPFKKEE